MGAWQTNACFSHWLWSNFSRTRFWNSLPTDLVEMHRFSSTLKMVFGSGCIVQFCTQHRYVYPNLLGFWPRIIHQFNIFRWTTFIFPNLYVKGEVFRVIRKFLFPGDSHHATENFNTFDIQHICGILYCHLCQVFSGHSRNGWPFGSQNVSKMRHISWIFELQWI